MKERKTYILVGFILLLYVVIILQNDNTHAVSLLNLLTFGAIVLISAIGVFEDQYPYSMKKFFWIFNLVFLGYIPTMQYLNNRYPWIGEKLSDDLVLKVNILVIICLLLFRFFYKYFSGKTITRQPTEKVADDVSKSRYYWIGGTLFFVFCALIIARSGGIVFVRSDLISATSDNAGNTTENLLVDKVARSWMLIYAIITIQLYKYKRVSLFWLVTILAATVLTNFPLALPRYLAATIYIGLALTYRRWFNNPNLFPIIIIASLFYIFPIMTEARHDYFSVEYVASNFSEISAKAYSSGDFDAYTMLCKTVEYTDLRGIVYGEQLSGVLLFFVPRSFWPDKPVGSGYFIGQKNGFYFLNVSCPYLAEGYLNFGIPGALLLVLLFALIFARLDKFYWTNVNRGIQLNFWILIYPTLLGMFFFMMRGDLLSSYAYTFGMVVTAYLVYLLVKKKAKKKKFRVGQDENFMPVTNQELFRLSSN
ncbi:O-antigen polysaccharide polymerase Wzy [Chitinophaga sancti]|uniref:oligosaccharide repeat unit polymerase n=1 Tax=Chitinophaga sancti TaxID=1004 RepID=UPI002A750864|nr:O-antigen polysaccharide polymerase Wzy [Chitinophaga sancti]WPQ60307.1 O-antigen polysaccharide polymerase Wzy [Chitinophaga sancti]